MPVPFSESNGGGGGGGGGGSSSGRGGGGEIEVEVDDMEANLCPEKEDDEKKEKELVRKLQYLLQIRFLWGKPFLVRSKRRGTRRRGRTMERLRSRFYLRDKQSYQ